MSEYNPYNLPTEPSKILVDFIPNKKQVFEYVDTVAIVNPTHMCPCTMDRIRQDTGERVYFVGLTKGLEFIYVDEKYTEEKTEATKSE